MRELGEKLSEGTGIFHPTPSIIVGISSFLLGLADVLHSFFSWGCIIAGFIAAVFSAMVQFRSYQIRTIERNALRRLEENEIS